MGWQITEEEAQMFKRCSVFLNMKDMQIKISSFDYEF